MLRKFSMWTALVLTGCISLPGTFVHPPTVGAGEEDVLRLPHIVASRAQKRVEIEALTTDVKKNDILEFLLIANPSGHGYESLAVSEARPSDVKKALEFIGMKPGHGVDPEKLRFWPKGERVIVSVLLKSAPAGTRPIRAERLVMNERKNTPFSESGFVFTGSTMIDDLQNPGTQAFAADAREPNSIIANYNELESILDVPRQAPQNDVYRSQTANPDMMLPTNSPVTFVLEPEYKDGKQRVRNLALTVAPSSDGSAGLDNTLFTLTDLADNKALHESTGLNAILKTFTTLIEQGHDPFVTVQLADSLALGTAHDVCKLLSSIETDTGIRVDPPPNNHLYYRAFVPNERLRERKDRVAQPWELHLSEQDGKLSGKLVAIDQTWHEDRLQPDLTVKETPVANAEELTARLAEDAEALKKAGKEPRLNIILVFAPPAMTHARLMGFVGPALKTHPIVHVYLTGE